MKNMRLFYEKWNALDANSPIAIGELLESKSALTSVELNSGDY
jgi:hypothetical protein